MILRLVGGDGGGAAATPWKIVIWTPATLMIPERDAVPVFGVTVNCPVPEPVPLMSSVIQGADVDAVHSQAGCVVTVTVRVVDAPANVMMSGVTVKVHPAPGCVTTNVSPAIVSVPVRPDEDALFGATEKPTPPLPVRLAPLVIVIHGTSLAAVQLQAAAVVTPTLPLPPAADMARLPCESVYAQLEPPGWVTV